MLYLLLSLACTSPNTDSSTAEEPSNEPLEPTAPAPFVLETSGEEVLQLNFSEPSCSSPQGSTQLRAFWRDPSHVFVLGLDIMDNYTGIGSYTSSEITVRARLQEEAGGEARYFATSEGVSAEITWNEEGIVAGNFSVESLNEGSLLLSPTQFPIWCTDL